MAMSDAADKPSVLDLELPEIEGRSPFTVPTSHLVKTGANAWGTRAGRRVSKTMLVTRIREAVDEWRDQDYPGASAVTRRLFQYWFEEDHPLPGGGYFRYYFCQREAVEAAVYLHDIRGFRDAGALVQAFFVPQDLLGLQILTSAQGARVFRRYIPEINKEAEQELPPEGLSRYAVKMATGSGKTYVMALLIAWSYLRRRLEGATDLADNVLIIAPNVIVFERLEQDFASGRIFHDLPIVPPEWCHEFALQTILRGDARDPGPNGNLFLTNIQQLYEDDGPPPAPLNPVAAVLGPAVSAAGGDGNDMLERVRRLDNLMVINDEAHHVHDAKLKWHQTLVGLHEHLQQKGRAGLSLWLDFSATPKNQNGTFFPWIICDYPLAQAVEDRIVKTPLIIHQTDKKDPDPDAYDDAGLAYSEWIGIAVERWRQHVTDYGVVGEKPILFVMAETTKDADAIAERLGQENEFAEEGRLLVIHTKADGEITKADLDKARHAAREVDKGNSRLRAIVSVLMLREGWDVRNVSVILGLRPFSAKANILPEQAVGRGLRIMAKVPRDNNQILELIGTNAFEDFIRQLEREGVGIGTVKTPPKPGIEVFPLAARAGLDIAIPNTGPLYARAYRSVVDLDPMEFPALGTADDLDVSVRQQIDLVHGTVDVRVASDEVEFNADNVPAIQNLLAAITQRVERKARTVGQFAVLLPKVRDYVRHRCFDGTVGLDDVGLRRCLNHGPLMDAIAALIARRIGELTATRQSLKLVDGDILLSATRPFIWRRRWVECDKTVFNVVACYNELETRFAEFLDRCLDIDRFAALAEWFTTFNVQYLSATGAVRLYYPDFVAVQIADTGPVYWIVETKGREWEDTDAKAEHMARWCQEVSVLTGAVWRYLKVPQGRFALFLAQGSDTRSFQALVSDLCRAALMGTGVPEPRQNGALPGLEG
jgi:type III restriction enzyme